MLIKVNDVARTRAGYLLTGTDTAGREVEVPLYYYNKRRDRAAIYSQLGEEYSIFSYRKALRQIHSRQPVMSVEYSELKQEYRLSFGYEAIAPYKNLPFHTVYGGVVRTSGYAEPKAELIIMGESYILPFTTNKEVRKGEYIALLLTVQEGLIHVY